MDDNEDRYIYLNPVTLPNEDDQVMVNTFDTRHDVLIKHTTWRRGANLPLYPFLSQFLFGGFKCEILLELTSGKAVTEISVLPIGISVNVMAVQPTPPKVHPPRNKAL